MHFGVLFFHHHNSFFSLSPSTSLHLLPRRVVNFETDCEKARNGRVKSKLMFYQFCVLSGEDKERFFLKWKWKFEDLGLCIQFKDLFFYGRVRARHFSSRHQINTIQIYYLIDSFHFVLKNYKNISNCMYMEKELWL